MKGELRVGNPAWLRRINAGVVVQHIGIHRELPNFGGLKRIRDGVTAGQPTRISFAYLATVSNRYGKRTSARTSSASRTLSAPSIAE